MNLPPFLSIITFTPFVAGVIILFMPKDRAKLIKSIAAVASFSSMVLALYLFATYFSFQAADPLHTQYQFQEQWAWVPSLGIGYHVGADGINLTMLMLTGIVSFMGVLISWGINERPREFFAFFMFLVAGVYGVFMSLDLFLLVFFYELSIFPMYFLIANWGWPVTREYAAMKLTLYLLIGSIVALVGLLAVYFSADSAAMGLSAGQHTFDMLLLQKGNIPLEVQRFWFLPIFIGFGVLAGIWPFHNWSPDGHVAAPTAVSMIHAGVLMKLGAYAALVTAVKLLPDAAKEQLPFVIFLVTVNVIYGAAIAMVQKDFKYVIGFSSVSHMGLVTMGFATLNQVGLNGAVLQMFSHGIMTALFFSVVGMIYARAHTRQIPELSGWIHYLPLAGFAFIIGGLVSMGMPGLSGFVAELQIFMGLWQGPFFGQIPWYPIIAVIAIWGVVLTAAYVLRVVQQVFFGEWDPHKWHDLRPINLGDKLALVTFSAILIIVGIFPGVLMNMISSGTLPVVKLLGG
jgi:NADH-quinone oxidoreductase subunit M